ncbi:MAG: hypothetical protein ABW221_27380 [Vicinamibacteria bacterium]
MADAAPVRARVGAALVVVAASILLPLLAAPLTRPVVLNLGPNDQDYVRGFREDWERDGRTRFRWTTFASTLRFPVGLEGDGHVLQMRVRRHFIEPATVTASIDGVAFGRFEIASDSNTPYRTVRLPLPTLRADRALLIDLHTTSTNPRPLGMAVDWAEVVPASGRSVRILPGARMAVATLALGTFLALLLAGARTWWSAGGAVVMALAVTSGLAADVVAFERVLREGWAAYLAAAVVATAVTRWTRARRALGVPSDTIAAALVALVLGALAVRLAMLLHPGFYYPDVRVHALFAWQLARRGLVEFLRDFTANQYRYSLGLQFESGHWYAFPYPPAFYLMTWPLTAWARYRPEVAVALVAAVANSLEVVTVFAIARRLRRSVLTSLAAAACVPLLPIFIVRLSLAYFPALVGHAFDAVVLWYLLARARGFDRPRVVVAFAVLLAAALLTYTQAVLNFAVVIPLFLLVEWIARRSWRPVLGIAAASALGVLLSLAAFYGRYVPIVIDMARGVPMAEEQILVEKQERERATRATAAEENAERTPDDPYAGPGIDPVRGVKKAAWRLYVFYGWFALAVVGGLVLLCRGLAGTERRFAITWAATYLILNLLSGGLPGPNLVRYNKDHEIVAPLFCAAIATLGAWMWKKSRLLAAVYLTAFVWMAAAKGWLAFSQRLVFER